MSLLKNKEFQRLASQKKPAIFCYLQEGDVLVTEKNFDALLETKMVKWFSDKSVITRYRPDYEPDKFQAYETIKNGLEDRLGKLDVKYKIWNFNPETDYEEQIKNIEDSPGFVEWML